MSDTSIVNFDIVRSGYTAAVYVNNMLAWQAGWWDDTDHWFTVCLLFEDYIGKVIGYVHKTIIPEAWGNDNVWPVAFTDLPT